MSQVITELLDKLAEPCLFLARHGETDWNAAGFLQGVQDRPLSPLGYQQRKNLFFLLRDIPLVNIFTSKLQRTIETALPLSVEKKCPLRTLAELNEAKLGVFEGEHRNHFSDDFSRKIYTEFMEDEINICLPGGGENLRMVYNRVQKPLDMILKSTKKEGNILVVAHRNVNKMLIKTLLGLSFQQGYQVEQKNSWLYIFAPTKKEIYWVEIKSPDKEIAIKYDYQTLRNV